MEKFDVSSYSEGLQKVAKVMDLPFEDAQAREGYVLGIIGFVAGL